MIITIDTREQNPLTFQMMDGVTVKHQGMPTGDYGCIHSNGEVDQAIIERKSISDLFSSFTGDNYLREKEKIKRAKDDGKYYILAIEAPIFEVRKGHSYKKSGQIIESKKSGISQIRQILTLLRRGDFKEVWWCQSRSEMAFMIQEYFYTKERELKDDKK